MLAKAQGDAVRNTMLAMTAILAVVSSGGFLLEAVADGAPVVRQSKQVRRICEGPKCGSYAPCGARCQTICPDRYSCFPLYGAYGPYGGIGFWGAYTFTGWGPR
jgi:hypothetical protein